MDYDSGLGIKALAKKGVRRSDRIRDDQNDQ